LKGDSKTAVEKEIRLPCHLNLAACYTNLKNYKKAKAQAIKALEIDERNVKGLWRRGLAEQAQGDWEVAKKKLFDGFGGGSAESSSCCIVEEGKSTNCAV